MALGDRIKRERESQDISIKKMAFRARISEVYLREVEKNEKKPSFEIVEAIAKALKRPLDYFSSKGEEFEELIEREYERILKTTRLEHEHSKELERIKNIRVKEAILSLHEIDKGSTYSDLKITYYKRDKEIFLDGSTHLENEIEVEGMEDEVNIYPVSGISNFDKRDTGFVNLEIDLVSVFRERGEITLRKLKSDKSVYYNQVIFTPALKKGERARFRIILSNQKTHMMTRDEILKLIKDDKYIHSEPIEISELIITYPTDKFIKKLMFPKDYDVKRIFFSVSTKGVEQIKEKRRLKSLDSFNVEKDEEGRWICTLSVDNPIMGMNYCIYWEPPSEEEYKKLLNKKNIID